MENSRLGETRTMKNGMNATIIAYRGAKDLDVQFEDGYISKNKTYVNFQVGKILNPNTLYQKTRIGETRLMKCGMNATIIEYKTAIDITVKFEDGYISKKRRYTDFKRGEINNRSILANKRIGETRLMKCGMNATIIEYVNCKNITVQFEDGTIIRNKGYCSFVEREILNPIFENNSINKEKKRLGECKLMNCGMFATIINYRSKDDIDVRFEDGSITYNKRYGEFQKGGIASPNLNAKENCFFNGFTCKMFFKNDKHSYYKVKHQDGFEGIMTPQEMLAYNSNC